MQVFVPYADYEKSAASLDNKRLNKQILECTQLLDIMFDIPAKSGKDRKGWINHPAYLAWKNNPGALVDYLKACVDEAKKRSLNTPYAIGKLLEYEQFDLNDDKTQPIWFGDLKIHGSHKIRLLQKGFEALLKNPDNKKDLYWYVDKFELLSGFKTIKFLDNFFDVEYFWPVYIDNSYQLVTKSSKETLKTKKQLKEKFGGDVSLTSALDSVGIRTF